MNQKEVIALQPGDIIRRKDDLEWCFIVTQNFGERVIAVRTIELHDLKNWELINGKR
jgi:hypothetical protein